MACDPTARDAVVKLTEPLLTGIGSEMAVSPSKNSTVPDATPGVMLAMNVSEVPEVKAVVPSDSSRSTSVGALFTVWIRAAETAPLKVASPLYRAVMVCVPPPNNAVLKLTVPSLTGRLPEIATVPSKKTTVPVAEAGATLAVKVSVLPNTDGFVPALKTRLTTGVGFGELTVCRNGADELALKAPSPLYWAVMECVPMERPEMVMLAEPFASGNSPEMTFEPSKNVTVPVAEPGATVAVKVSESPKIEGLDPALKLTLTLVLPFETV